MVYLGQLDCEIRQTTNEIAEINVRLIVSTGSKIIAHPNRNVRISLSIVHNQIIHQFWLRNRRGQLSMEAPTRTEIAAR